jgi:cytochrome c-type biogenesis protein
MQSLKEHNEVTVPWGRILLAGLAGVVLLFVLLGTWLDSNSQGATAGAFSIAPEQPFLLLAIVAFIGGLFSFLSPCTLPILPAYFAFAFQSGRKQIATNTLAFMIGVATMFSLFGAAASALGSVLRQNQELIVLLGGALIIVFGVMSILGQGFSGIKQQEEVVQSRSVGGSFLFGLTFAAGWSSCIGPILGFVLTMAATTASVWQGTMLLFIFALGLGLPLILVSTFIGRASRDGMIWRVLRGKGWLVEVPVYLVVGIWSLVVWVILTAVVQYAFYNFASFGGQPFTPFHGTALFVVTLLGAGLWLYTSQGNPKMNLSLHTTGIISGVLFLLMGYLMLSNQLTVIAAQFAGEQSWLVGLEEWLYALLQ